MSKYENTNSRSWLKGLEDLFSKKGAAYLLLGVIVIIVFLLGFMINAGWTIAGYGITLTPPRTEAPANPTVPDSGHLLDTSGVTAVIALPECSMISEKYFPKDTPKSEVLSIVRRLVERSEEYGQYQKNVFFRLLTLEITIAQRGQYLDTHVDDIEYVETYKTIQSVLLDIGYFSGPVTGEQRSTCLALTEFQKSCNRRNGKVVFEDSDLGLFGNRTLEAIRNILKQKRA